VDVFPNILSKLFSMVNEPGRDKILRPIGLPIGLPDHAFVAPGLTISPIVGS